MTADDPTTPADGHPDDPAERLPTTVEPDPGVTPHDDETDVAEYPAGDDADGD